MINLDVDDISFRDMSNISSSEKVKVRLATALIQLVNIFMILQ